MPVDTPRKCHIFCATLVVALCLGLWSPTLSVFVGSSQPNLQREAQRQINVGRQSQGAQKSLKDRIGTLKGTARITDAMRKTAMAKVKMAERGVKMSRPFNDELQSVIKGLCKKLQGTGLEKSVAMLRVPEKVETVGLVLMCSEKGLCGGFNNLLGRRAEARLEELQKHGISTKVIAVGRKATIMYRRFASKGLKSELVGEFRGQKTLSAAHATEIATAALNLFLSGEVQKVEIIYGKYVNAVTSTQAIRTLLPLTPFDINDAEDESFALTVKDGGLAVERNTIPKAKARVIESDIIFEQEPEEVLETILPLYVNSLILYLQYESLASELGAKITAMQAATDRANDLVFALTIKYNKARQEIITSELLELNSARLGLMKMAAKGGTGGDAAYVKARGMQEAGDPKAFLVDEFQRFLEDENVPVEPMR